MTSTARFAVYRFTVILSLVNGSAADPASPAATTVAVMLARPLRTTRGRGEGLLFSGVSWSLTPSRKEGLVSASRSATTKDGSRTSRTGHQPRHGTVDRLAPEPWRGPCPVSSRSLSPLETEDSKPLDQPMHGERNWTSRVAGSLWKRRTGSRPSRRQRVPLGTQDWYPSAWTLMAAKPPVHS